MTKVDMIRIEAPYFTAGLVFEDEIVVGAAPIIKYMKGWTRFKVEVYCVRRGWKYLIRWVE